MFKKIAIKSTLYGLLISLLIAVPTYAASLQKIKERGSLSVAVYTKFAPFSDELQGIDIDIAKKIGEKLGVKVSILPFDADESMDDDLRNMVWKGTLFGYGPADLMMHVPVQPEFVQRNDKVKIFSAYFRDDIRIARNLERIPELDHIDVFEQELIGVEDASFGSALLTSIHGGQLTKNVRHYVDLNEAFDDLKQGKLSAVLALGSQAESAMGKESGYTVEIAPLPGAVPPAGWAFGVAVKNGNNDLANAVEQAMRELEREGALDQIFATHGVKRLQP